MKVGIGVAAGSSVSGAGSSVMGSSKSTEEPMADWLVAVAARSDAFSRLNDERSFGSATVTMTGGGTAVLVMDGTCETDMGSETAAASG